MIIFLVLVIGFLVAIIIQMINDNRRSFNLSLELRSQCFTLRDQLNVSEALAEEKNRKYHEAYRELVDVKMERDQLKQRLEMMGSQYLPNNLGGK